MSQYLRNIILQRNLINSVGLSVKRFQSCEVQSKIVSDGNLPTALLKHVCMTFIIPNLLLSVVLIRFIM